MKKYTMAALNRHSVNRVGQSEAVRQSIYDIQTYAAAGQTSLTFFAVPVGQSGKTLADTNMDNAGVLPHPKQFLIESIEIRLYPGVNPVLGAIATAASNFSNDVYAVSKSGYLDLFIGSKSYLTEGPLERFPPKTRLHTVGAASDSSTAGATGAYTHDYAAFSGRPYRVDPPLRLISNQNFKVTLNWPVAVALPSTVNARIGVFLDGVLYRQSQ